ncbi:MAG: hypothetical protein HY901_33250 [Deltaproteobacteria bacterium]|nr:hypothetical protein [Deltaproteobacteria bacterium]
MDVLGIAKQAGRLVWTNKYLWFFGFFVASAGGGAGAPPKGKPSAGGAEALPGWLWPVLAAAALAGLVALILHVVSEAALIEGIQHRRENRSFGIRLGFSSGLRHFWRVVGVKMLAAAVVLAAAGLIVAPVLLAVFKALPLWIGIPLTILLALAGVPLLLTGYFLYEYALRFAVLEGAPATDAYRAAMGFLHGRIVPSVLLLVTSSVSAIVAAPLALVAAIPAAIVGGIVYLTAGLVPALASGVPVLVVLLVPVFGALGTFRSAVWTLGFLDARKAA